MRKKGAIKTHEASKTANNTTKNSSLSQSRPLWERIIPPSFLAILTAIVYYPSLNYPFQFDDLANISKKFHIRFFQPLSWRMLIQPRFIGEWLNRLSYKLGGFDPFYYRTINLIIHMLAGLLLFFLVLNLCSKLKKSSFLSSNAPLISFLTAALFLLHPVQTQTISYVIQARLEGLAVLVILACALCFVNAARSTHIVFKSLFTFLFLFFGAISCGTKEIVIVTPFLIMAIDWFFIAESQWLDFKKRLWMHIILSCIIFGIFIMHHKIRWFQQIFTLNYYTTNNKGNILTKHANDLIKPLHYLISEFKVILHYLLIFVWPFDISVEYDWKLSESFFAPDSFFPFIALATLGATTLYLAMKKKVPFLTFGLIWFFIAIAPRSSIIPSSELICDYKTYLASIGILFILAVIFTYVIHIISTQLQSKETPQVLITIFSLACSLVALGYAYLAWQIIQTTSSGFKPFVSVLFLFPIGIIVLLWHITTHRMHPRLYSQTNKTLFSLLLIIATSYGSYARNKVWETPEAFWRDIVKKAPLKARGHNNLGVALSENNKFDEAITHYKRAIKLDSHYSDPWSNIAVAYSMKKEIELAISSLHNAIRIFPNYPEAYNNLGTLLLQKKEFDQAEKTFNFAIKLRPWYGKAYFNLSRLYMDKNENEKAWQCMKKATEGDFDNQMGFTTLGNMSLKLKKYDAAIKAYTRSIEIGGTKNLEVTFNLANAYFMSNEMDKALAIYKQLSSLQPGNPSYLYNFGETLFSKQAYTEALEVFTQAKNLENAVPQTHFRIVHCLEKLGRKQDAVNYTQILTNAQAPQWFLKTAKQEMARLSGINDKEKEV